MGGSTKQKSTQTTQTQLDPWQRDISAQNWDQAQTTKNQLAESYGGPMTTDYSGTPQAQAQAGFSGLANFGAGNLAQWQNPYTNDVVNTSMNDIEHQRQVADQKAKSEATQAGAWGGDGASVLRSLNNDSYARTAASTAAGLRSQGFDTALQAAQAQAQIQGQANSQLGDIANQQYAANTANLDRLYNAWLAHQQGLATGQQLQNQTLFGMQFPQTQTSTGESTTSKSAGVGDLLGGLGALAMGIGSGGLGFAPFATGSTPGISAAAVRSFGKYGNQID